MYTLCVRIHSSTTSFCAVFLFLFFFFRDELFVFLLRGVSRKWYLNCFRLCWAWLVVIFYFGFPFLFGFLSRRPVWFLRKQRKQRRGVFGIWKRLFFSLIFSLLLLFFFFFLIIFFFLGSLSFYFLGVPFGCWENRGYIEGCVWLIWVQLYNSFQFRQKEGLAVSYNLS